MSTPADRLRARGAEAKLLRDKEQTEFDLQVTTTSVDLFHYVANSFQDTVHQMDYKNAYITKIDDIEYVGYSLYSTVTAEGDVYYESVPISILFDEYGQHLFACETEYDGSSSGKTYDAVNPFWRKKPPVIIDIPKTAEEFNQFLQESSHTSNLKRLSSRSLVELSAAMLALEDYIKMPDATTFPEILARDRRKTVATHYEALRQEHFPQGFVYGLPPTVL